MTMSLVRPYMSMEELLGFIEEPNRSRCLHLFNENRELFQTARGSVHNHQAWEGGYWDHVLLAMNCGLWQYRNSPWPLPFSLSSLLLVLSLHDLEKPWKYEQRADGRWYHKWEFGTKDDDRNFRAAKLKEYGISLTLEEENAMLFVEGEMGSYSNRERVMNELAGLCHVCDILAARVFHGHPLEENDPWPGARRVKS